MIMSLMFIVCAGALVDRLLDVIILSYIHVHVVTMHGENVSFLFEKSGFLALINNKKIANIRYMREGHALPSVA